MEQFFKDSKNLASIIDNMYEAISLSYQFYRKLENAELYDEIEVLRHQMSCCFRVLGAVANANELSKYEGELANKVFDICVLTRDIVDNCRSKLRREDISLEFDNDEHLLVNCDPNRYAVCLLNMIVNSLQNVNREDGVIRISLKVRGETVSATVTDNGYGLSPDVNIEERFNDACGLAVINKFCESVGTTPIFESGENDGFSVSVRLPIVRDSELELASSRVTIDLGTFSPVNIYLAKVNYIRISDIC